MSLTYTDFFGKEYKKVKDVLRNLEYKMCIYFTAISTN